MIAAFGEDKELSSSKKFTALPNQTLIAFANINLFFLGTIKDWTPMNLSTNNGDNMHYH